MNRDPGSKRFTLIQINKSTVHTLLAAVLVLVFQVQTMAQMPGPSEQGPALAPSSLDDARESQPAEQSGQAQQLMKEARVELERAADAVDASRRDNGALQLVAARNALDQFDQSLEQLDQSVPGHVPRALADALHAQVASVMWLLDSDPGAATDLMRELALRVTDITAEADLLIGRVLLGSDGETVGNISNVLISAEGRILALVVDRLPPSSTLQFTVDWEDVTVRGPTLNAAMPQSDTDRLPDYSR